ncbi:hypothetical protein [Flavobacterium sp.]|uniref:hypothetical protein n=1 Tax=Flavobacterium sp. TaxID=239 RepID=UPI00286DDC7E|nr:hypothetical protein [Flavobacterium sp.]
MFKPNLKQLGILVLSIILLYTFHKLLFWVFDFKTETFTYSLEIIYLFFSSYTIITILLLIKVKEKNIDIVGNTFLLISSTKMVFAYLIVKPVLKNSTNSSLEKWNFFALFIIFLVAETLFTIYLLNAKNPKKPN